MFLAAFLLLSPMKSTPEVPPKGDCVVVKGKLRCTPKPDRPRPLIIRPRG